MRKLRIVIVANAPDQVVVGKSPPEARAIVQECGTGDAFRAGVPGTVARNSGGVCEPLKGGALTCSQQGTVIIPETAESHFTQQQLHVPFMVAAVESAAVSVVAPTHPDVPGES